MYHHLALKEAEMQLLTNMITLPSRAVKLELRVAMDRDKHVAGDSALSKVNQGYLG